MIHKRLVAYGLTVISAAIVMRFWLQRPPEKTPLLAGEAVATADYFLDDFSIMRTDSQGNPTYRMKGAHLSHYPNEAFASFLQPELSLYQNGQPSWSVHAREGRASTDGQEVELTGRVHGSQIHARDKAVEVRTDSLRLRTREQIASTSDIVTLTSGEFVMQGRGLRAQLETGSISLLSEVTAQYAPTK